MNEMLLELLRTRATDGWEVTDVETCGWEFYFIGHRLDQSRTRDTRHTQVHVYKKSEDGAFLGRAEGEIAPTATPEEARDMVEKLLFQASLVKNPYYELVKPAVSLTNVAKGEADGERLSLANVAKAEADGERLSLANVAKAEAEGETLSLANVAKAEADGETLSLAKEEVPAPAKIAADFLQVMRHLPETKTEDINSYEIFVSRKKLHFLNSEGVDVSTEFPSSMLEVVVNARKDGEEIELYRNYTSGSCGAKELSEDLSKTLAMGRDRLLAEPTPVFGEYAVVFSTDAALSLYEYFIRRLSTGMIYQQVSDWTCGLDVMPKTEGDRFTVRSVLRLPNSSANADFDGEGSPIRALTFLEKGVVRANYGPRQFSWYLGQKDSFLPGNFVVEGGTKSALELRKGTFLEVVEFSDFQVDPLSGDIAGEIRLGYLFEEGRLRIVSGGSVSGNMREAMKEMWASREERQYDNCRIPAVTRVEHLTVTGAV